MDQLNIEIHEHWSSTDIDETTVAKVTIFMAIIKEYYKRKHGLSPCLY